MYRRPLSFCSAQIYFNIFLFATDIYEKSHKLVHTAILSCHCHDLAWDWRPQGPSFELRAPRPNEVVPAPAKYTNSDELEARILSSRLPYWLHLSAVGKKRRLRHWERERERAEEGKSKREQLHRTKASYIFLLLLFPRT